MSSAAHYTASASGMSTARRINMRPKKLGDLWYIGCNICHKPVHVEKSVVYQICDTCWNDLFPKSGELA